MENKKVWLVIEKNTYGDTQSFSVIKHHTSIEEAMRYKVCLEKLNDRKNQTYFLASDTDTILNNVAKHHNKSVENGTHPDMKKSEEKKLEEEMPF